MKNTFCYSKGIHLDVDKKASADHVDCIGCSYIEFCKRDLIEDSGSSGKRKKRTRKVKSREDENQLSLFDIVEDDIVEDDVVIEDVSVVREDKNHLSIDLGLSDLDFGITDYVRETDHLTSGYGTTKRDVVVDYDGWITDEDVDKVSRRTDGKYGIDLSEELPYFTVEELSSLGRFRSKYWN